MYLADMKQGTGHCHQPAAAFHLANGARLERIQVAACHMPKVATQSHPVLVMNYRSDPDPLVLRHEAVVHAGRIVMSCALQRGHHKCLAGKD